MNSTTGISENEPPLEPSKSIEVEFEENVPIPEHGEISGPNGKWYKTLDGMKVGQSFVLDSRNSNLLDRENVKRAIYYYNRKTKIRNPGGPEYTWRKFGTNQVRVWRTR